MSYWPAIIEWFDWIFPYVAVIALVAFSWRELKSLRGEEIRSVCVCTMLFTLAYALGQFDDDKALPWFDPMWLLAIVAMVTIALISWDAQRAKLKFAEYELELGRKSRADPRSTLELTEEQEI